MKSKGLSLLLLVFGSLLNIEQCSSEKILVLSFISTKSHKLTYMPLVEELGKRGHDVTVLSPILSPKPMKNVRDIMTIDGVNLMDKFIKEQNFDLFKMKEENKQMNPFLMFGWFEGVCRDTYDLPQVQAILNESFDLILMQPMFNDCALGLVYRLKAPLVLFSPVSIANFLAEKVGVYFPPSFIPNVMLGLPAEMNFFQRFQNFGMEVMIRATLYFLYEPKVEEIYREKLGNDIPSASEILGNASLILSNGHFSLHSPKPLMPDIVDVGGLHSAPAEPLPKDLEDFIKKGKDGFILFSMGSAIKGDMMPEAKRKMILSVFSKLKQQVLWKWESETMPDLPKNVKLSKWLPQQDLLGHKDIKMFITHCGGGSTEESIYHGVPLVGFPMLGDQLLNAELAKKHGFIVDLDWNDATEEQLMDAIQEILNNPKYRNNVQKLSTLFKDRPTHPKDLAVYWVEYVLRHKGATHLRSAGRKLNYWQYHSYDVILAYITIITVLLYVIYAILRSLTRLLCRLVRNKKDPKKQKTN
ncbi:unnamed protein product [Orchesella dallaii]|uniref:UDP-glucuronosyltransferase n=1 Tax=Orchesella dallaii TaxID=48710 RepID=A0ABP1Q5F5_9HEXA